MSKVNDISNLELSILLVILNKGKATIREIYKFLKDKRENKERLKQIPYTIVVSTINSLASKKIVKGVWVKRRYIYSVGSFLYSYPL